jgi:transcriptional regulator with XRE-family HTH domain
MHQDEDIQVAGTMIDYLVQKFTDEEQGKEFASEYLKSAFLTSAANGLFYMRRQAGLTQAQVAERLNTKQSAIARLEDDFDGGISLRRYVDFALACGVVPHDITFAPLESAISYTIAQPKILFTQVNYQEWLKANSPSISTSVEILAQQESNSEVMSKILQIQPGAVFSIDWSLGNWSGNYSNIAPSATTLRNDIFAQGYFQPYLIPPLQLLRSGGMTSTADNQSHIEVSA